MLQTQPEGRQPFADLRLVTNNPMRDSAVGRQPFAD